MRSSTRFARRAEWAAPRQADRVPEPAHREQQVDRQADRALQDQADREQEPRQAVQLVDPAVDSVDPEAEWEAAPLPGG